MKSALLYGARDVRLEEVDIPEVHAGEVLIKIDTALTCGTDAKVYLRGGHPRMIKLPSPFGHEFAGVIAQAGAGVKGFREGDRVVSANSAPCMSCFHCKRAEYNLCEDLLFINGAYAEYIKIPLRIVLHNLHRVADGVSLRDAALVEPLACVLNGVSKLPICPGTSVAISGAGPIGLLFLQVVRLKGARAVVLDIEDERLRAAKGCGAEVIVDAAEPEFVRTVRDFTGKSRGVDVAIDASGIPAVWEAAIGMARKGGTVCFFGGCPPKSQVSLDTERVHYCELTLKGVFHHTPYFVECALDLISRGRILSDLLITRELPLSGLGEALEDMCAHRGMKTAIVPGRR